MSEELPGRVFLGKQASILTRTEVYLRPGGFEVDDRSLISVRRSWILFDEVTLVSLHAGRAWASALLATFFAVIFAVFGAIFHFAEKEVPQVSLIPLSLALLFAVVAFLSLVVPVWVVTIQGQRSRATMSKTSRQAMQALYDEAVRQVTAGRRPRGAE